MRYTLLTVEVADRIGTITIHRPDKLNALNDDVLAELDAAVTDLLGRDEVGGLLITGAGTKAFVAGADIAQMVDQGPLDGKARALRGQAVLRRMETGGKPVVAAVNGFALGGGCELAMACHLRVAGSHAKFGQPEVKLGICPGFGGTQRLPRLVGQGVALDILLTGRMVDAEEALRIGLVNRVVAPDQVVPAARDVLAGILAMGPLAVAACIEAVDRGLAIPLPDGLALEANHFGLLSATNDQKEGMRAFLEKRSAHFTGR
ncbi:MAG: enoyl-CoA hydratase-related protein [Gemmatimonadales bacterium]